MVRDITDPVEFQNLLQAHDKVVVDFYASWCRPCQMIAPEIDRLEQANPGILFLKVNADVHDADTLMRQFNVRALPTLLYFHKSQIVANTKGTNKQAIGDIIAQLSLL